MPRFGRTIFLAALLAAGGVLAQDSATDPFAQFRPSPAPHQEFESLLDSSRVVAVVPLRGETDDINFYSLRRRFAEAKDAGAGVIVLDIDSPGGPVGSSIRIANLIGQQQDPPVVAYVSQWAISGGAMAALATPHIVMNPRAQMGDIQPIMMAPGSEQQIIEAPEKFVSPIRAVLRTHAEQNGYPVAMLVAMVDPDVAVYRLHLKEGEAVFVNETERAELEASDAWERVERAELIVGKDKLLTLTARQAEDYAIAARIAEDQEEAVALFATADAKTVVYEPTAAEDVVAFLNAPWLTSILMLVGLGSLYIAVRIPGFGVPETMAIVCFTLLFFSKAMVGKADILEASMFIVGVGLILLEVFAIPSFGVIGVAGILMVFVSLVLTLQDFAIPQYAFQWERTLLNLTMVIGSVLGSVLLFMLAARALPGTPVLKRLVLTRSLTGAEGYTVETRGQRGLVGAEGISVSTLRPSGRIEVDGQIMQAVTEGEMIDKDERIRILDVSGNRITVGRA